MDFVDGVIFGPGEHYLNIGRFVDEAPYASDYTFENIYYQSIRERERDYLATLDYIWRWDTDWFWCSRLLYAQNPLVRRLLGRKHLNSTFYKKAIDWEPGVRLRQIRRRLFGVHHESIVQDVDVAVEQAPAFLDFFQREIGMTPIWICPLGLSTDGIASRFSRPIPIASMSTSDSGTRSSRRRRSRRVTSIG